MNSALASLRQNRTTSLHVGAFRFGAVIPKAAASATGKRAEKSSAAPAPVAAVKFGAKFFLAQVAFCAVVVAVLLPMEQVLLAGIFFWSMLGLQLARAALLKRSEEMLCLLIAFAPFINLLRGLVFYNIVGMLFGSVLAWHFFVCAPNTFQRTLAKYPLLKAIFFYVTLYYSLSLFNTHEYAVNLRLFELALTVLAIVLLGRDRAKLGTALTGAIICAWAVGLAMLSHMRSDSVVRLGMTVIAGYVLGNPTQLGIPLALGFLGVIIDRGRWLNLESRPILRWLLLVPTLPLLALTTSRSSWLVSIGGMLVNLALGRRQQLKMLFIFGLIILAINAVLISPYGKSLQKGFDRTFSGSRNNSQRTSGRTDQWLVAWTAFTHSPATVLLGHGPGNGPEVYSIYSSEISGVKYAVGKKVALHSLFMQIMVEAGLLGLISMAIWLLFFGLRILRNSRGSGEIFPLVCFCGYVFIVITVSGNDVNSGIFLGIAMLGTAGVVAASKTKSRTANSSQWKPAWIH